MHACVRVWCVCVGMGERSYLHTLYVCVCVCVCVCMSIIRLKALKEPVYSQKEAEAAAGMGNYVLCAPDTMAVLQDTVMEDVGQSTTA